MISAKTQTRRSRLHFLLPMAPLATGRPTGLVRFELKILMELQQKNKTPGLRSIKLCNS